MLLIVVVMMVGIYTYVAVLVVVKFYLGYSTYLVPEKNGNNQERVYPVVK